MNFKRGPNQLECASCGDQIEEWKYTIRRGSFDPETQNYERPPPLTDHYCKSCSDKQFKREVGAYYEVTDGTGERLWNILKAADGQLVADCLHLFVGARTFFYVDEAGEVHGHIYKHKGDEPLDWSREDFDDVFEDAGKEGTFPRLVILKPFSETPLSDEDRLTEQSDADSAKTETADGQQSYHI